MAKRMNLQSAVAINFLKMFLSIFLTIFIASGIAILMIGIYMYVELYRFVSISTYYYHALPEIFMGIGLGILLVGILGCFCTFKEHGIFLHVLSVLLLCIFIVELCSAVAAFVLRSHIEQGFNDGLTQAMEEYDTDMHKNYAIDGIQMNFKCCGKDSYRDWLSSNVTDKKVQKVPISCCKTSTCDPTSPVDINQEGCYFKLSTFMDSNFLMVGVCAIVFAFLQLLGAMLSCCLGRNINKVNYEQVE